MQKITFYIVATILFYSCSGVKISEKALNSGDYDTAIFKAKQKISGRKDSKKAQKYIPILETAFQKAVQKDNDRISFLVKENNPEKLEEVYETYQKLKRRQQNIKPILPLHNNNTGKNALIPIVNYDIEILKYKAQLSDYLFNKGKSSLTQTSNKHDFRKIYKDLSYLDKINPNFKNTRQLINEAHEKGTDYVKINLQNSSQVILPKDLENELYAINTTEIDNLWTIYHTTPKATINYDYDAIIDIKDIQISPEKITERQLQRQKIINDGWEYLKDKQGKIVKNEKGEKIKVDKNRTVTCEYYEFTQFKAANATVKISFTDTKTKQTVDSFPLNSEFIFDHIYAEHKGDKRALEDDLIRFLGLQSIAFPTNEQMTFDVGQDIKRKLIGILRQKQF